MMQRILSSPPTAFFTITRYADRRIGTKRNSTGRFNAPAILRNIAKEWPS